MAMEKRNGLCVVEVGIGPPSNEVETSLSGEPQKNQIRRDCPTEGTDDKASSLRVGLDA